MKPMTLKADKDKITFGFKTNWIKQFDEKFGATKNNPLAGYKNIDIEGSLRVQGSIKDIKQFISTLLKEQRAEILKKLDKEIELLEGGGKLASYKISALFDLRKKL